MTNTNEPHQGWRNAQTWCVAMVIDNNYRYQTDVLERLARITPALRINVLSGFVISHLSEIYSFAEWAWDAGQSVNAIAWDDLLEHYETKLREREAST